MADLIAAAADSVTRENAVPLDGRALPGFWISSGGNSWLLTVLPAAVACPLGVQDSWAPGP
ncbi:hypothetical protein AS189_09420 [Arthrobacter alpinus]|uniref:Uncharacterized protein n=1 Tax=Arthrobacter alpinus TaxID=656366 RepID=A0A0S2LZM3_9MICC|nr:hypothetical protein AS189_09420 [Arthrobacter alpinus]